MAVSDPKSERYGQHYTRDEVAALVGPADEEVEVVTQWLSNAGAENIHFSYAREYCHFSMTVEKVCFFFYLFVYFLSTFLIPFIFLSF